MQPARDAKVILRRCDSYDVGRIREIVREGLDELGLRPRGKTLVKPNLVAAGPFFEHAHTRVEVMEGVLEALRDRAHADLESLSVGERSGITMPTRFTFEGAGYDPMLERLGVERVCFEEVPQVEVALRHPERLRDSIFVPETVAKADFFVNVPKFKAHPWTTVTFSMKNYIGIQDDRHRLLDHDHALDRKVADLQYVIQPELVVLDAIIAGEGRMLTPEPRHMGLVILGNNQLAVDAVCCRMIGLDPRDVAHLRLAWERGFGPIDPRDITITGDVPFDEARERAAGYDVGLVRVESYFRGTSISAYAGPPPGHGPDGYCWGGCPGVMEEVIEILRLADADCDRKLPRVHIVFGKYDGPLDMRYGDKVLFVGACAEWSGPIADQLVQIGSRYVDRSKKSPHDVKHDDMYAKMAATTLKLLEVRRKGYTRLEGCPVSVAELVLLLAELGGIKNPYFEPTQVVAFNRAYLEWRMSTLMQRLKGQPYQIAGPSSRGGAAPELDALEAARPLTTAAE